MPLTSIVRALISLSNFSTNFPTLISSAYDNNTGSSTECCDVGTAVGRYVGAALGRRVGMLVGLRVGRRVGVRVGARVGFIVGPAVGVAVGAVDGDTEGDTEGGSVGVALGISDGISDGTSDGTFCAPNWNAASANNNTTNNLCNIVDGIGRTCLRPRSSKLCSNTSGRFERETRTRQVCTSEYT
jgi:hypothetical protein